MNNEMKDKWGISSFIIRGIHYSWHSVPSRCGLGGFTNAAFGNTIWYWEDADEDGTLEFTMVIDLGEGATPADRRISYDNRFLYISLRGGGKVVQYDIADPKTPTLVGEVAIPKPTMMRLSPDSEWLYVTNSLLSSQDDEVEFGA